MKNEQYVIIDREYNKEGYLVSMKINGIDVDIPKQELPTVCFTTPTIGYVSERSWVTEQEYINNYKHLYPLITRKRESIR